MANEKQKIEAVCATLESPKSFENASIEGILANAILAEKCLGGIIVRLSPDDLPQDKHQRVHYVLWSMETMQDLVYYHGRVMIELAKRLGIPEQEYNQIHEEVYSRETQV